MRIGEVVKDYRDRNNLSQREFGRRSGLSHVIIQFLEKGERSNGEAYIPKFDTIKKVAYAMGTTPEELITSCDDFEHESMPKVGLEEASIVEDFLKELSKMSADETMLIQAYRMIPIQHRIEAMQAVFGIKDKYLN